MMDTSRANARLPRPLPASAEKARLNCLRDLGILETGNDAAIDNLVESVANFFRVPMTVFTLIDEDRQWFKSRYGLHGEGTERADSFCQYTICQTEVFRVPDTWVHPEFKSYPAVIDYPNIRYYAGVPVRVRDGHALGSLCIMDQKPNAVPVNKLTWLNHFAGILTQIIELNYAAEDERIIQRFAGTSVRAGMRR